MNWLTVAGAAQYSGCHPETIRIALREGFLRGVQAKKRGTWHTKSEWVDDWMMSGLKVA
jgi:hypothetical protein